MIISHDTDIQKDVKVTAKQKAQEMLLQSMQIAFVRMMDSDSVDIEKMSEKEKDAVWEQMSKQMARVENMFGYEKFSWNRGC